MGGDDEEQGEGFSSSCTGHMAIRSSIIAAVCVCVGAGWCVCVCLCFGRTAVCAVRTLSACLTVASASVKEDATAA